MTGEGLGDDREPAADHRWSSEDIQWLCASLESFVDLHDPSFVRLVRTGMGRRLDRHGPFPVAYFDDSRSQIMALAEAVAESREPALVLRALTETLRYLRGDTAAMATLDELADRLAPTGRLRGARLRDILTALNVMKPSLPTALDAMQRALLPDEPSGLRGIETVAQMVTRLNDVRDPASARRTADMPAAGTGPAATPLGPRDGGSLRDTTAPPGPAVPGGTGPSPAGGPCARDGQSRHLGRL